MTAVNTLTGVRHGAPGRREIERSYAQAERVTAQWARSFYFASRFLPRAKRKAVFALYDYCRYADNLVDERADRSVSEARGDLFRLAHAVRGLHAGRPPADRRWLALWDTLSRYQVPLVPLLELLQGVALDLGDVAMPDFAALHEYCRLVAGGVGLMLGPVLGASSDKFQTFGVKLGIAMQLTNVLRDVAEDLDLGRIYLPADEMARFGICREDLERRIVTPEFRRFMIFQVARARSYFAAGDAVVGLFPSDGSRLTVRLLQMTYGGILDRIESMDYDVFRDRAYVPLSGKIAILGRALARRNG